MKRIYYLALAIFCLILATGTVSGQPIENRGMGNNPNLDFTEGGHFEDDFNADMMAEWWYLNGDTKLVGQNGEKKNFSFFVVLAHQEISEAYQETNPQSYMLTFNGLYFDNGTADFNSTDEYIPRNTVTDYIAFNTPYVDYKYPDGNKSLIGNHLSGYHLDYRTDKVDMDLYFQTNVDKTVDETEEPLNFTTYERSYGHLHGTITLDGKEYRVTQANGYMDHMIPYNNIKPEFGEFSWTTNMHGWSWSEVTTKNYQTIAYALRSPADGYTNYSYKHLTLLDKHTGEVLEDYSGNDIKIEDSNPIDTGYVDNTRPDNITRPKDVEFSTSDLNVKINASQVAVFDYNPWFPTYNGKQYVPYGFVDFMSHQPDGATIEYKGDTETGSAFYEYLVSDRVEWPEN